MNVKKAMMIAIVAVIIVLLGYFLPIVFSFEGKSKQTNSFEQVDDSYINVLYSYLPTDNYSSVYNNYNAYFTTKNNLSKTMLMAMTYNYIVTSDRFKLIALDDNELQDGALCKISLIDFRKAYLKVFSIDDFQAIDFEYNDIKGIVKNEYMFIYKNDVSEDYVNYKNINSYALTKDGEEIVIYDYYVKCNKMNNTCYNDANMTIPNSRVNSINNINEDNLVKYKHVFKYDKGSYYWYSSEVVK